MKTYTKRIREALFILLTLLCANQARAQSLDDTIFQTVAGKMKLFEQYLPWEKVYVHQDRTRYTAGETVWFKVYSASSREYPVNSGVVYVDIVDGNNHPVTETKWRLENESGSGQITLPDTLAGGRYLLRAYTKWMQNLGTERFFTRELQISSLHRDSSMIENRLASSHVQMVFFPEGGNLVAGIPSKVAFKATDNEGNGVDVKGTVVDREGNEIRHFGTTHSGQGYFYFEPEAEKSYYAILEGLNERIPLPDTYPAGIVMSLNHRDDRLRILVRHNLEQDKASRPFYLTIHKEGKPLYNARVSMYEQMNVYDIPYNRLPEGVFTITLYDETLFAYCERLAFVNFPEVLPLFLKATKQKEIGKREKVTVEMEMANGTSQAKQGDFSVAVVKAKLDNTATRNNYYTDYFLKSELKGKIEHAASYFDKKGSTSLQNMDLLLLTHGWRRYTWEDKLSDQYPDVFFPAEPGLTFSGRVLPLTKSRNLSKVEVTAIFRHDSIGSILSFLPAEDGRFVVTDCHFPDTAEVILSAQDAKRRTLNLVLNKDSILSSGYYTYSKESPEDSYGFDVEITGEMLKPTGSGIDKMTHQLPDINVTARKKNPKNYRILHNEELNLYTYKPDSRYTYSISGGVGESGVGEGSSGALGILEAMPKVNTLKILGNPDFFLDGMRVPKDALKGIPASAIDRVELLLPAQAMIYGAKGGAIMFWVKDWTSRIDSEPVKTITHKFVGYNQQKEFYAPDYTAINDPQTTDHRNTLYWQPELIVKDGRAEFSFFTSDDPGEYVIHCEGRSADGLIGVTHCLIRTN